MKRLLSGNGTWPKVMSQEKVLTTLTNVEAFSGGNGAVTNLGESWDYMTVRGDAKLTISMFGARMRNNKSDKPFTVTNPKAVIQAFGCFDKNENPFNMIPGQ